MSNILMPGLIDPHVHFREPGLTHKATMTTEAAAAHAGGIATVCEMPNTIPPTVTVEALADKVRRASTITLCDMRFFFGITDRTHIDELRRLWTDPSLRALQQRCSGVKLYLDHSTGNQKIAAELLCDVFATCAALRVPVVCHCEDPELNAAATRNHGMRRDAAAHSLRRPPESEAVSIATAISLTKQHGTQLHIAHLSTAEGIALVAEAKAMGLPVTCEVAPQHLFLTTDDYEHLGALAKINPPLRERTHQIALWEGIRQRIVDCIATDHAPHTLAEKRTENPLDAPSGVPGVETMLPLLLTVASGHWPHPHAPNPGAHLLYEDIARLCFQNPNRIFHLGKEDKTGGNIRTTVVIDSDAPWTIRGEKLHSLCGWTPYEGWKMHGRVVSWC